MNEEDEAHERRQDLLTNAVILSILGATLALLGYLWWVTVPAPVVEVED